MRFRSDVYSMRGWTRVQLLEGSVFAGEKSRKNRIRRWGVKGRFCGALQLPLATKETTRSLTSLFAFTKFRISFIFAIYSD
jgi:hypothetical protein